AVRTGGGSAELMAERARRRKSEEGPEGSGVAGGSGPWREDSARACLARERKSATYGLELGYDLLELGAELFARLGVVGGLELLEDLLAAGLEIPEGGVGLLAGGGRGRGGRRCGRCDGSGG